MNRDKLPDKRIYATILGRVQGVGFRYFVYEYATRMDLKGWVRNTYNEQVIVTAEGPPDILEKLLAKLRGGPRSSFVLNVSIEWQEATGELSSFQIAATK